MNPALSEYWIVDFGFAAVAAIVAGLTWAASLFGTGRAATKAQKVIVGLGFLPAPTIIFLGLCFAHLPSAKPEILMPGNGVVFIISIALMLFQFAAPFLLWRTIFFKTVGQGLRRLTVLLLGGVALLTDLVAVWFDAIFIGGASP